MGNLRACVALAQLLHAVAALPRLDFVAQNGSLSEHHRFGLAMGSAFSSQIARRFEAKAALRAMLAEASTAHGAELLSSFVSTHDAAAPDAMAELRGLAEGAGRPFDEVFLMNIALEFTSCSPALARVREAADDCSDFMACEHGGMCAVGHNEDNQREDVNATALVTARWGDGEFSAYTYMGELPSGAFGFNSHGVAFTLNWVGPTEPACPGLGRGFISRRLLDATSLDAAIAIATDPRTSAGHNYQLLRAAGGAPAVLNVEVGPRGVYAVRPIGPAPFFHANQYVTLRLPQTISNSSRHRTARAAQLPPPRSTADILHSLGDQADTQYPIFHDDLSHARGDLSDWTLASALFDLRARTLTIFGGNPREGRVLVELPLPTGPGGVP